VNATSDPQAVDINLPGASLAPEGKLITLTGHNPEATNTIDQPTAVVPVESGLHGVSSSLHHRVPAYTIEVMELDVR
jgi:alpha-N-arabinofuranosidase